MSADGPDAPSPRVLTTADDVSPEWLSCTLRLSGLLPDGVRVKEFGLEPIGAGAGLTGSVFRLSLGYHGQAEGAPPSVILKLAASDDDLRALLGGEMGLYEREVMFYRTLAARVPMTTPRCFYGAWNDQTQHATLLLEDLRDAAFGADDESCGRADGEAAVSAIARLHVAWWCSPELMDLPWLWLEQEPSPSFRLMIGDRYPLFRRRFGDAVEPEMWPFLERIAAGEALSFTPIRTLLHGDFTPKNVCVRPDGTQVVFDWQFAGRGNPANDLLRYLAACLADGDPRERMESLLGRYHGALSEAAKGVYPMEALRRDVRAAAALRLSRPIGIGGDPADIDDVRTQTVLRELRDGSALLAGATTSEVFGERRLRRPLADPARPARAPRLRADRADGRARAASRHRPGGGAEARRQRESVRPVAEGARRDPRRAGVPHLSRPGSDARRARRSRRTSGADVEQIVCGLGSDDLIDLILRAIVSPGDAVINCPPTFGMYPFSTEIAGGRVIEIPRQESFALDIAAIEKSGARREG